MVVSLAIIISLSWLEEWGSLAFHRQGFFVRNIRGPVLHLGVSRMVPVAGGLLAFGLALAGILLGSVIRTLPKAELSSDSKEVVKLSLGYLPRWPLLFLGCWLLAQRLPIAHAKVK